jgi:hypothetical protein
MIIHIVLRKDTSEREIEEVILRVSMTDINERRLKVFGILSGTVPDDFKTEMLVKLDQVESVEPDSQKTIRGKTVIDPKLPPGDTEVIPTTKADLAKLMVPGASGLHCRGDYPEAETLEAKFQRLAAAWKQETAAMSSTTQMVANPHHKAIIALGMPVVPLILRSIQKEPDHWFYALRAITGAGPTIPKEHYGDVRTICRLWVEWGLGKGLI